MSEFKQELVLFIRESVNATLNVRHIMFNDASSISKPYDFKCNVLLFVNYLSFSSVKVYQQILFL